MLDLHVARIKFVMSCWEMLIGSQECVVVCLAGIKFVTFCWEMLIGSQESFVKDIYVQSS
jgi:hypothetical protein